MSSEFDLSPIDQVLAIVERESRVPSAKDAK